MMFHRNLHDSHADTEMMANVEELTGLPGRARSDLHRRQWESTIHEPFWTRDVGVSDLHNALGAQICLVYLF